MKQLFQWEHDLSKGSALALLGAGLALFGTAALSLVKDEASWWVWVFFAVTAGAIGLGVYSVKRVQKLLPEYVTSLESFARFRSGPASAPTSGSSTRGTSP